MDKLNWLVPWEFSPTLILVFGLLIILFIRGSLNRPVSMIRHILFWFSIVLIYLSMHSKLDYYAERVFFIHRIQHLIIHHIGPFFLIASFPNSIIRAGISPNIRYKIRNLLGSSIGSVFSKLLTHRIIIPILFVSLVLIWLVPSIQFYSMIDLRLYKLMNWSVLLSGIAYWNIILDRRTSPPARMKPGVRIISPILTMLPQMIVGAVIVFSEYDLYPLFELCGRAIPIEPETDQIIGGLIIWIISSLFEFISVILALKSFIRLSILGKFD